METEVYCNGLFVNLEKPTLLTIRLFSDAQQHSSKSSCSLSKLACPPRCFSAEVGNYDCGI